MRRTQDARTCPQLDWYEITRYNKSAGEMLVAFELLLDEGASLSLGRLTKAPHPADHYIVPEGIRPKLKQMRIEVIWITSYYNNMEYHMIFFLEGEIINAM